jgi:hypothetical protein
MHTEHPLSLLIRWTLARLAPEFDASCPSRCQAGLDPGCVKTCADQKSLESYSIAVILSPTLTTRGTMKTKDGRGREV